MGLDPRPYATSLSGSWRCDPWAIDVRVALPEAFRAVAPRLGPDIETVWYTGGGDCPSVVPGAEVLWLDMWRSEEIAAALRAGEQLRWVTCADAGVDSFSLHLFRERGIRLTNGRGLNALPMAEFVLMETRPPEGNQLMHHGGLALVLLCEPRTQYGADESRWPSTSAAPQVESPLQ